MIDLRKVPGVFVRKVMKCEHDRDTAVLGDGDHALRDRIAAVREHHIGAVDIEELREELHDRADVVQALLAVPGRFLADKGDRHIVPARVEHARMVGPADRGTKLVRLVQVVDHLFNADLRGEVELGGAERLAFKAMRREPLENIQRGHGGAVGKVEDRVHRREQDPFAEGAPTTAEPGLVVKRVDGVVMGVGSQRSAVL